MSVNVRKVVAMMMLFMLLLVPVASAYSFNDNSSSNTPIMDESEMQKQLEKDRDLAKAFLKHSSSVTPDDLNRASETFSPIMKVISWLISLAILGILAVDVALVVFDLAYIKFPFTRSILGGKDGVVNTGTNISPMGGMQGSVQQYGGQMPAQQRSFSSGGIVTDIARDIASDPAITSKISAYIKRKVANFVLLGVALVLLTSSIWLGIGFNVGQIILKCAMWLFSWLGNPTF